MKKIHLLLLMIFIVLTSSYSQTTETFETEMSGSTTFTDNGQTFNITSQAGGPFSIIDPGADFGWNGTAPDRQSIDNSLSATFGTPAGFTISSNKVFMLKSFYLYLARENLTSGTGTCTITGKKSGATVFTATASTGFTDPMSATNNGFTLINLSSYGGANNASEAIDQFVIATTGTFEYLSLDAMKWQTIVAPTVTTTSASSIGATKATMGGNATADGGATISERGIVWATTIAPTIANSTAANGSGTGNFSGVISSFPAGTKIYYRAYATNAISTSYGAELNFTTKPELTATQSQTNVLCNLSTNGSATVTPSGGVAPYIYSWLPNGGTAATASGLVTNNYSCKITDNEGTIITKNFTITQPTVISGTTVVSNVSCFGGTNGTINLTPTGGTSGYTFRWGDGFTTEDRTGQAAGTYTCVITDSNGCTGTVNVTVAQPTAPVSGSTVVSNVSCFGGTNGSINLTPTGGTQGYTFNWGSGITTEDRTGLATGNYSCIITDAKGCTGTVIVSVAQPTRLLLTPLAQTNIACNSASNGSASVNNATGGTSGYIYDWTPGSPSGDGTTTVTGLTFGTYNCTVTDANGCTASQSFTITQPTVLSLTPASQTNLACFSDSNGSASVNNATGGISGYSYNWTPGNPTGDGTTTVTGLTAGIWTCTVTDSYACSVSQSFIVTRPPAISVAASSQTNIDCFSNSNGAASIFPSGGTSPYTYLWNNGATTQSITGLAAGAYSVTVTDAYGCTALKNFNISQPTVLASSQSQTNVSCFGGSNGSASVVVSGGTSGYTYLWSPNGGTNATASGLSAGTYSVLITDANGCTATQNFTISEPTVLASSQSQTNVSCFGGSNGSATVLPSGGTAPYTYLWLINGGNAATATGLFAGNYTCQITDNNGCIVSENFTITEPTAISVVASYQTNVTCYGGSNGVLGIYPTAGTPPYTFLWENGSTEQQITGLTFGSYNVVVTDYNGCTASRNFIITQPNELTTTGLQNNVPCNGFTTDTFATVIPSGGTAPYSYTWNNGATTQTISEITAGNYFVTIYDASGCSTYRGFSITSGVTPLPTRNINNDILCEPSTYADLASKFENASTIKIYASSTSPTPFNPQDIISPIEVFTTFHITQTLNGCESSRLAYSAFVNNPPKPIAFDQDFCGSGLLVSNLVATLTQNAYGLKWYNVPTGGNVLNSNTPLVSGNYYVTQNKYPCGVSARKMIVVTISLPTDNITTISACDSYTWNGIVYSNSGVITGTTTNCVTEKLVLTINPTPVIASNANQNFNVTDTLANIIVSPTSVVWYANLSDANAGTSPLLTTQVLVNNTTYYAVASGICPSNPFAVLVNTTLSNNSFNNNLNIDLYPNPSNGIINLKLPTDLQIEIYNNLGQMLSSEKMFSGPNVINITDKPAGVYFLKANDGNNISTFKIIKN